MSVSSPESVLHALRLTGVASAQAVAERVGLAPGEVAAILGDYGERGLAVHHSGRLAGWGLTTEGRRIDEEHLSRELDALGARETVELAYSEFMGLNEGVLTACSQWQVRSFDTGEINDHSDPDHDSAVLGRLTELHASAVDLLDEVTRSVDRFGGYPPRLDRALARAEVGQIEWVTRVGIDSYHTVWFELHEDLLATLGRSRSDESAGSREAAAAGSHAGNSSDTRSRDER